MKKPVEKLRDILGDTDIYLVDSILKDNYQDNDIILDAGCGGGRNMKWFLENGFTIFGIDSNETAIANLKLSHPQRSNNFQVGTLEALPYEDKSFHHIICSAVLHFARNTDHFMAMMYELVRVLKVDGTLFIRMTTDVAMPDNLKIKEENCYYIPDGSLRFLLNNDLLQDCLQRFQLRLIAPYKSVHVDKQRSMGTLLLQKMSE